MKTVLVTGVAGFIGYHVAEALLARGDTVVGLDNMNDYYDPQLKRARRDRLAGRNGFSFSELDLQDGPGTGDLFAQIKPHWVVHLAAQPGVRYGIAHPHAYTSSNVVGTLNVLEGCRHHQVEHLVYASSSSVYGSNTRLPFKVGDNVDHPVSLYAASKKANELFAHAYSHLYGIACSGLRFFTVYGPWGRPDMAVFKFVDSISRGMPIDVYGAGEMWRDFTYIDDVVEGVVRLLDAPAKPNPAWSGDAPDAATSNVPYRIYNIGNSMPVKLTHLIEVIEEKLGRKATRNLLPMQPGDVVRTCADVQALDEAVGFRPSTPLEAGIAKFIAWYLEWRGDSKSARDARSPSAR
jgi:UDP-glucuronate 4-epimerase